MPLAYRVPPWMEVPSTTNPPSVIQAVPPVLTTRVLRMAADVPVKTRFPATVVVPEVKLSTPVTEAVPNDCTSNDL